MDDLGFGVFTSWQGVEVVCRVFVDLRSRGVLVLLVSRCSFGVGLSCFLGFRVLFLFPDSLFKPSVALSRPPSLVLSLPLLERGTTILRGLLMISSAPET